MIDTLGSIDKWKSQFRKGFLELCILMIFKANNRNCGVNVLESLRKFNLPVSEGTLYPLLSRLSNEGILVAEWDTPLTGHPRKYYILSELGAAHIEKAMLDYEENHQIYLQLKGSNDL